MMYSGQGNEYLNRNGINYGFSLAPGPEQYRVYVCVFWQSFVKADNSFKLIVKKNSHNKCLQQDENID